MDMTSIERGLRNFGLPAVPVIVGIAGMIAFGYDPDSSDPVAKLLAGPALVAFLACLAAVIYGLVWSIWRLLILHRWEQGELNDGCINCAGDMAHKGGRYGGYSVCRMCGAKREGHH